MCLVLSSDVFGSGPGVSGSGLGVSGSGGSGSELWSWSVLRSPRSSTTAGQRRSSCWPFKVRRRQAGPPLAAGPVNHPVVLQPSGSMGGTSRPSRTSLGTSRWSR